MPKRPTIAERTLQFQAKRIEGDLRAVREEIGKQYAVESELVRQLEFLIKEIERLRAKA